MKQCTVCEDVLPLDSFSVDRKAPDGHRAQCKGCHGATERARKQRIRNGFVYKAPVSGAQAILEILQDGQWHATQEIREVCGVSYGNRIGDLRRKGFQIVRKREYGGLYGWQYRLILDPSDPEAKIENSPKEILLGILRDGLWHSNLELYEKLDITYQDHLYFLRKEGFVIQKKRDPETNCWCYKLEVA